MEQNPDLTIFGSTILPVKRWKSSDPNIFFRYNDVSNITHRKRVTNTYSCSNYTKFYLVTAILCSCDSFVHCNYCKLNTCIQHVYNVAETCWLNWLHLYKLMISHIPLSRYYQLLCRQMSSAVSRYDDMIFLPPCHIIKSEFHCI